MSTQLVTLLFIIPSIKNKINTNPYIPLNKLFFKAPNLSDLVYLSHTVPGASRL